MRVQEENKKKKKKTKVKEETREFTMGKTKGAKENIVSRAKKKDNIYKSSYAPHGRDCFPKK